MPDPYLTVGKVTITPQEAWTDERTTVVDGKMAFSPWHGLVTRRPLGVTQRAHQATNKASADFRWWLNHDLGLPDSGGALAEDALAVSAGWAAIDTLQATPKPAQAA